MDKTDLQRKHRIFGDSNKLLEKWELYLYAIAGDMMQVQTEL